jgi:hypothetical protein
MDTARPSNRSSIKLARPGEVLKTFSNYLHRRYREMRSNERSRRALCTHAVMENTGSYWNPAFNLLEAHIQVILAKAADVQNIPAPVADTSGY